MSARRPILAAMGLNFIAVAAMAETIVVRPDPCPIDPEAPRIITLSGVEAVDLNPGRASADHILVLYPLPVRGWASARLLARFDLEGERPARRRLGSCR